MKITRRSVVLAGAMLGLLGLLPFSVAATSGRTSSKRVALGCGQTITSSITLTADVTGCPIAGLIVGASGITINLNGHTISSANSNTHDGIDDPSFSSVKIENGTVTNFANGIVFGATASGVTVQGMRVSGNTALGIQTQSDATIAANSIFGNGSSGIDAIGGKLLITNNVVEGNAVGIDVSDAAAASKVTGNHALANIDNGIQFNADGGTISGNISNENGLNGYLVGSSGDTPMKATGNTASYNVEDGIILGLGDTDGGGNKAANNQGPHQCLYLVCS